MGGTSYAPRGMVSSDDHLASAAGVAALRAGGTAADACVAANAVLAVTAPHACGLGGDLFALVRAGGAPVALNASGRAGSGAEPARLRSEGHKIMPFRDDIRATPIPGCVDGWLALHRRYGRLPLAGLLASAIEYAERGFPAAPGLAEAVASLPRSPGAEELVAVRAPGDLVRRPGVAAALRAIASEGRSGFYQGAFGAGLLRLGAGEYIAADLDRVQADWVAPLRLRAFGHDVWTAPPNSQGYLLLLALGIAEGLPLPDDPADPRWPHLLAEAARMAGHDRPDVLHEAADVAPLLEPAEVAARRALIAPDRRAAVRDLAAAGDTTYLCAVDAEGMGVSLIQSIAGGFGGRVFEPVTGIPLQNRGTGFSLRPGSPAEYGPGRRPPHTLAPALVTRADGTLRAVTGAMGGDAQPQIVLQILIRLLRHGATPGEAIDAPRWMLSPGESGFETWTAPEGAPVEIEHGAPSGWAAGLRARGHRIAEPGAGPPGVAFGHAHLIETRADGVLAGAADPRAPAGAVAGQ